MSERRKPPAMPADGWFWSAKGNKVGLEIAHQPALEYLHRDRLSPSSAIALTSNGSCAVRSMSEKLLGSSPSPLDPTEVGTLWHAVAESLYGLAPENRTEATATRLLSKACAKVYPPGPLGSPSMNRWLTLFTTVRNAGWGTFEMEDPTSIDIVSLEEEVADVEVNGVPFLGYIDRTRRAEDGSLVVGDFKTSQKMPANITRFGDDHGDQLRLYVIAKRELGCEVSGAELLYTRNTIAKVKPVAVSQSKLNATASMFKQAWRKQTSYVEDGWIPTSTSPLCGWCPLVAVCPSAKKEGLVDRSNSAVAGLVIENRTGLPDEPAPAAARGRDENEPTSAVDGTAAAPSPITAVTDADLEKAYADLPPDPYGDVPARTRRPAITDAEIETARPDGHVEYDDLPDEPVVRPTRVAALNGHTPNGAGTQTSPGRVAVLEVPDHIIAAASAEAAEIGQRRTQELRDETTNIKESLMHKSHTDAPLAEGKAYDETVGDKLNAAGFAAGAVFSLTMTAGEELAKRGASLRHDQLKEVTNLLLTISNNVAEELTGRYGDLHGGGHKLARYALFTSMKSDPLPWNASAENWKRWVKKTTTKCLYTCNVAIDAYYDGVTPIDFDLLSQIEGDPWAVGSDTQ